PISRPKRWTPNADLAKQNGSGRPLGFALVSVREDIESHELVVIQEWWPDSGRVTDVDDAQPQALRPQPIEISERSHRRRMGACRAVDPAGQAWRRQGHRGCARSDEPDHVHLEQGLPVACAAQGPAAEEHGARLSRPVEL